MSMMRFALGPKGGFRRSKKPEKCYENRRICIC